MSGKGRVSGGLGSAIAPVRSDDNATEASSWNDQVEDDLYDDLEVVVAGGKGLKIRQTEDAVKSKNKKLVRFCTTQVVDDCDVKLGCTVRTHEEVKECEMHSKIHTVGLASQSKLKNDRNKTASSISQLIIDTGNN